MTTSLGLGSGDFLPGFDVHLNSMLGESDLLIGPLEPGRRMESMMAPGGAVDDDGLVLAAGAPAARVSSRRSCRCSPASSTRASSRRPPSTARVCTPTGAVVHLEPGFDEGAFAALEDAGLRGCAAGRPSTTTSEASAGWEHRRGGRSKAKRRALPLR